MEIASREKTVTIALAGLCVVIGVLSFLAVVYFTQAANTQDRMNTQAADLQATIDQLQTEKASLQNQITSLQNQITDLNTQNSNLATRLTNANNYIRDLNCYAAQSQVGVYSALMWTDAMNSYAYHPMLG